jgi:hypothetical protein
LPTPLGTAPRRQVDFFFVVEEAVLPEEGDVTESKGAAATKDDRVEGITLIALPYAGAAHPRHSHSDCQIVREAISDDC